MDQNRLKKLTKTATAIVGGPVKDLGAIHQQRTLTRTRRILHDTKHPLYKVLAGQRSERGCSRRLRSLKTRTDRFQQSFVPTAIRVFNENVKFV